VLLGLDCEAFKPFGADIHCSPVSVGCWFVPSDNRQGSTFANRVKRRFVNVVLTPIVSYSEFILNHSKLCIIPLLGRLSLNSPNSPFDSYPSLAIRPHRPKSILGQSRGHSGLLAGWPQCSIAAGLKTSPRQPTNRPRGLYCYSHVLYCHVALWVQCPEPGTCHHMPVRQYGSWAGWRLASRPIPFCPGAYGGIAQPQRLTKGPQKFVPKCPAAYCLLAVLPIY
jgi:hypothetical protein